MKINISLFTDDLIKSIGAGVYDISIDVNGYRKSIYIGESSYSMLERCAHHLTKLKGSPEYFGFTKETINKPEITLIFSIITEEDDEDKRGKIEIEKIKKVEPLSQSGIKDNMKNNEDKINALNQFLNCHT